ncbi:MAG: 50S ribosomal protein L32e [Candidatus Methanomethylophilaceae archaeon]|nr:50S ribosomal protein L32e [Candidatus Methanomethylophilaceae archaeon]
MTVKDFKDLRGMTDGNIEELKTIGINTVEELQAAVNDDAKVKEVIKTLSGVGPKTVANWKAAFEGEAPAKAEPAKKEPAKKEPVKAEEPEAEVVEATETEYVVKKKAEIDDETADALAKRALISGRRPAFKRQEWFRYAKFKDSTWRKPKGIHSKMKRRLKRRGPIVDIGFRGPASVRGLHPTGFEEVLVYNVDNLDNIDPKKQAIRIGGTVGTKKRMAIEDRADELGIRILNRMV